MPGNSYMNEAPLVQLDDKAESTDVFIFSVQDPKSPDVVDVAKNVVSYNPEPVTEGPELPAAIYEAQSFQSNMNLGTPDTTTGTGAETASGTHAEGGSQSNDGFPNGERPGDDAVDVALGIVAGRLAFPDRANDLSGRPFDAESDASLNGNSPVPMDLSEDTFSFNDQAFKMIEWVPLKVGVPIANNPWVPEETAIEQPMGTYAEFDIEDLSPTHGASDFIL